MSQHDYVIANDSGASVRADINSVLQAILSQNSGTSEPTSTSAGTLWLDTTGGAPYTLKIRDAGNNHWLTIASVTDPGADDSLTLTGDFNGEILSTATGTFNGTIGESATGTFNGAIGESATEPNKYYIQGKLDSNYTVAGGANLYVAGTTSPYFVWNDTLSNAGFDVGSSSNYDFKFTKKGIYQINFSASFHHVTSNTTRFIHCAIRGDGSNSVSTTNLASASDQIAQTLTGSTDYGNCACSFVGLFDVNDLINFWTDAGTPATDAVRRSETHVSVCLIKAVA